MLTYILMYVLYICYVMCQLTYISEYLSLGTTARLWSMSMVIFSVIKCRLVPRIYLLFIENDSGMKVLIHTLIGVSHIVMHFIIVYVFMKT